MITININGFFLYMDFDSSDEDDCEIMAEAFLLLMRRSKEAKT